MRAQNRTRLGFLTIAVMLAAADSPQQSLASDSQAGRDWLLYWTSVRPSASAAFADRWRARSATLARAGITVSTLVSQTRHYAIFMPLAAEPGRDWSRLLGPLEPPMPAESSLNFAASGAQTWVVHGDLPHLPAGIPTHLGLWFPELGNDALIEDVFASWTQQAGPGDRRVLRVVDGPDQPLFVTLASGADAAIAGAEIASRLAPLLRAARVEIGTAAETSTDDASRPAAATPIAVQPTLLPAPTAEPLRPLPRPAKIARDTPSSAEGTSFGERLAAAARESVARAPSDDAAYSVLDYPGGDPGWQTGSGIDVVVRGLRRLGIDLQQLIHEDILREPDAYGMAGQVPDSHIDHRRLRNLITFFDRHALDASADWHAGDVVFWDVSGRNQAGHVGVISRRDKSGVWVIHHYRDEPPFSGRPTEEQMLEQWPLLAGYRIDPDRLPTADDP